MSSLPRRLPDSQRPRRFPTHWLFLALGALFPLLVACSGEQPIPITLASNLLHSDVQPQARQAIGSWRIGFDRRLEPKEDVRQIASLAQWLTARTGLSFTVAVTVQDDGSIVDEICGDRADFAAVGTVSYLQAHAQCGARILARGRNLEGEDTYRAAIVVRADSPLQSVADLRGHSFTFGALNSTQGHLIPRLMLQQAGLTLDDLSAYSFSGSHAATANAVTSGRSDAGALQDTLARDLAQRGLVRILALSEPYPASGIIVGPNVPAQTVEILQQALLTLDPAGADAATLYHWERSEMPRGFVEAHDADYEDLRRIARTIGLLEP